MIRIRKFTSLAVDITINLNKPHPISFKLPNGTIISKDHINFNELVGLNEIGANNIPNILKLQTNGRLHPKLLQFLIPQI